MFGYEEAYLNGTLTAWQKMKPKVWALFDEPYSSITAKVMRLSITFNKLPIIADNSVLLPLRLSAFENNSNLYRTRDKVLASWYSVNMRLLSNNNFQTNFQHTSWSFNAKLLLCSIQFSSPPLLGLGLTRNGNNLFRYMSEIALVANMTVSVIDMYITQYVSVIATDSAGVT